MSIAVLDRAIATYRQWFEADPQWAAAAPGRVNLIGEHTDYNNGFVLPMAIDRWCVAVAGPAPGPDSCFLSADTRENWHADLSRWVEPADFQATFAADRGPGRSALHRGAWQSYIYGVLRLLHARATSNIAMPAINLVIASSVPLGAGLSSSAALEVAVAMVGEQLLGLQLTGPDRASLCRRAEHQYAGVPCGIMDQLISVLGRKDHALLIDCRDESTRAIPMPPPSEAVIVVMNSGLKHALASGEYAARKAACERAAAALDVPSLRDADLPRLHDRAAGMTDEDIRCARHVITENARTLAAAESLSRGDLTNMGRLMSESHASLRDDYRVSRHEIDSMVTDAERIEGVYGARITGGGFGGCAIALCSPSAAADVTARVKVPFHHGPSESFTTMACDGSRVITL